MSVPQFHKLAGYNFCWIHRRQCLQFAVGDMLDRGAAFLESQRHQHLTRTVVYRRGTDEKEVQATIGKTDFEQADESGLIHPVESRDFLVRTAGRGPGA